MSARGLLSSTGDATVDRLLAGLVWLFELVFAGRVRSYYLTGSYADGSAVVISDDPFNSSDLDLFVAFKGHLIPMEEEHLRQLQVAINQLSPVLIDTAAFGEVDLFREGEVLLGADSLLLYGEEIRDRVPLIPLAAYLPLPIGAAYRMLLLLRGFLPYLTFPLSYPDPEGEFYGYDQRRPGQTEGRGRQGTRALLVAVSYMATALLALEAGCRVSTKREAVEAYQEYVNDEWAGLIEAIYEQCKPRWGHQVPDGGAERRQLRDLCRQVLGFENHFVSRCQSYLLDQLDAVDGERQRWAIEHLAMIVLPGQEIIYRLLVLARSNDQAVRQAVQETMWRVQAVS